VSRFDDFGIRKVVEGPAVSLYVRGNCVAAVGGNPEPNQGATGLMTERGLAYLVWREGLPLLVSKGAEASATPEQVEEICKFTQDLEMALKTALST
jgi:hypothetical protein